MIPFTGKQLQLIQLLMEQSTPLALDEISQHLHCLLYTSKASAAVRLVNNVIHASDSHENAQRELDIWKAYIK